MKYMSHTIKTRENLVYEIKNRFINPERRLISGLLKSSLKYLDKYKVDIYPDIILIMKKAGLNTMGQIVDLIKSFQCELQKNQNIKKIDWIEPRSLVKANKYEKNIVMCALLFEYRMIFIQFIENYCKRKINITNEEAQIIKKIQVILDKNDQISHLYNSSNIQNEKINHFIHHEHEDKMKDITNYEQNISDSCIFHDFDDEKDDDLEFSLFYEQNFFK